MIGAERLLAAADSGREHLVLTLLDGSHAGGKALVHLDDGSAESDVDGLLEAAGPVDRIVRSGILETSLGRVFADVQRPVLTLVIVGAHALAEELCAQARRLDWRSVVIDARADFATPERLRSADEIVVDWPAEGLRRAGLHASCAVLVLSHDHKFDVPALVAALASPAFFVGALGSRRNHAARTEQLREKGVGELDLARIHAPLGLDIGGESTPETAISIIAQVIAARRGRTGGPLHTARGPIHALADHVPA